MSPLKTLAGFLALIVLNSCSQLSMVPSDRIRIAVPRNLSGLLVLVAQKENFFADLGLQVEVVARESDEATYKELESGRVQLAIMGTSALAYGNSSKVRILSEVYSSSKGMFLVLPDSKSKTKSLNEVKGVSIRVTPRSAQEWFMHLMSVAEGLDLNQNTLVASSKEFRSKTKLKNEAVLASSVELGKVLHERSEGELGVFSSRAHIEISFVATGVDSNVDQENDSNKVQRFLMALSKAEQKIYKNPDVGETALLGFIPELDAASVKKIMAASLFRVGLSNTLYVLLNEQSKWVRTRHQNRGQGAGFNIRSAMLPEYLRKLDAGLVTLSDDLLESP